VAAKKLSSFKSPANFMGGGGVASPESGTTPQASTGMGTYYGTGIKNPVGRMRSDSIGIRPVNRKQLGTPPKSVV
jgi:hypothetical protein